MILKNIRFVKYKLYLVIFLSFFLLKSCMPEYYNQEEYLLENHNYKRSVVEFQGFIESGTYLYHLHYSFRVADSLIRQVRYVGASVNTDLVRFYTGSKYEIIYNPEDPLKNMILLNKPVFDKNIIFGKTEGKIQFITPKQYRVFLWEGFLRIRCRYWVNGKSHIHWGGISKDLFFPDKDYNEITRKEIRQIRRKYEGKKCIIEYDIENPGVSRLVEESVVKNNE